MDFGSYVDRYWCVALTSASFLFLVGIIAAPLVR